MRVFVLVTVLLASSSLCPSFAQEQGKDPVAAPQTVPAKSDQKSQQQQDQRTGRDQSRADDREVGRDRMMRRGDSDRMGRDAREMGPNWRVHRDRETGRDRDIDADVTASGEIETTTMRTGIGTIGVIPMKTDDPDIV
jgi:hypothetical protein